MPYELVPIPITYVVSVKYTMAVGNEMITFHMPLLVADSLENAESSYDHIVKSIETAMSMRGEIEADSSAKEKYSTEELQAMEWICSNFGPDKVDLLDYVVTSVPVGEASRPLFTVKTQTQEQVH